MKKIVKKYGPTRRYTTRDGAVMVPCRGGCGAIERRPSGTKLRSWICERCLHPQPRYYVAAPDPEGER